MYSIGLVLEGGGMRGLYTAGVLEFFLEKGMEFGYIIGVSAGACNAASYISKQKGRNKIVNTKFINDVRFVSFRNLILKGSLFGMDFIFDEIPNQLIPYDYETFYKSPVDFKVTATDCNTGRPVYFNKTNFDQQLTVLRASSSLPLVSPMVRYAGYSLLDGGIADPLPINRAIDDGCKKVIVVLTRNNGYKKEPVNFLEQLLYKIKYRNYPQLIKALMKKHIIYHKAMDYIEYLEQKGQAVVIRPTRTLTVGRYEKNADKLLELHRQGYEDASDTYEKIKILSMR